MSTLLLAKKTDWCARAEAVVTGRLRDVTICTGDVGDRLPAEAAAWQGDHIISFVSPWIVPASLLARAGQTAINFHPGPPEYPGIGCYNFALYDEVTEYGVTCHHMAAKVDTGSIIKVERFPVLPVDDVASLKERSMAAMLALLGEMVELLAAGQPLPISKEHWTRVPFTRRELNQLGRVTPNMAPEEVQRRYRAMHFPPHPGIFMDNAQEKAVQERTAHPRRKGETD